MYCPKCVQEAEGSTSLTPVTTTWEYCPVCGKIAKEACKHGVILLSHECKPYFYPLNTVTGNLL